MLREALVKARHNVPMGSVAYHSIGEALAATAPPLPFGQRTAESGANLLTYNGHAIAFDDISGNERAAVVACLNALAEKENAR